MKLSSIALLGLFISASAFASQNSTITEAKLLLRSEKFEEAYQLLLSKEESIPNTVDNLFVFGMTAKESGHFGKAVQYFQQILNIDQNAHRVKLELAVVLLNQGKKKQAKQYLEEVKASNPPVEVSRNVKQLLATIASKSQKTWQVTGSIGWIYDSNVNTAPDTDSVLMFGLPFQLSTNAKSQSDTAIKSSLGINHIKQLNDKLAWRSGASISSTNYRDINNLDSVVLSASTGGIWKLNDKTSLGIPLVTDRVKVGHNFSYYSYSYGLAPNLQYKVNKQLSLGLQTTFSKKKYRGAGDRNLNSRSIAPSIGYQPSEKSFINASLTFAKDDSGLDIYSNTLKGLNVAYTQQLNKNLKGSLSTSWTDVKYKEKEAANNNKRHDRNRRISANLIYHLPKIKSDVIFSISDTDNKSNIDINKYDKQQVSLSISRAF